MNRKSEDFRKNRQAFVTARDLIAAECERAQAMFCPFNSSHEAYGVIREELDEFWDAVKANDGPGARAEAVQVAAMALRFLVEQPPMVKRRNGAS